MIKKAIICSLILLFALEQAKANAVKALPFEKEYRVALMLPFCLGNPDKWKVRDIMADYYEGVEMAVAAMEAQGLKMQLTVLDTKQDSLEVIRLLKETPDLAQYDLIIGPVYDNELFEVEKFCSVYNIPLVSPLRPYKKTLNTEFPLINCSATDSMQMYYNGQMVANAFKNFQVVLVDDQVKASKTYAAKQFKLGYESILNKPCTVVDGKITTVASVWNKRDSVLAFFPNKSSSSCNLAIGLSASLPVIALGPAEWLAIDRMNYGSLNGLYFYDTYSVPYNDTTYKQFRKQYRLKYGGDPERYTFIGYDQFVFFSTALMAFDTRFIDQVLNKSFRSTHRNFQFVKRGNVYENAGTNLFYYQDYNLYKALWRY
ncbi:MAG: hypothetical protein RLZZ318_687 [Bacteroidota bacterium]